MLRMHAIKNCPVTVEDVNVAEKIFGPDIATMKGKMTRQPSLVVQADDVIEVPPELKRQYDKMELAIDLMFVNNMPFLTAIDSPIKYRSVVPLKNKDAKEIFKALEKIIKFYKENGFFIKIIHADREFKSIFEEMQDLGVQMNFANTEEHVPTAERNNRTIGERIRAGYHHLPYKAIPRAMI